MWLEAWQELGTPRTLGTFASIALKPDATLQVAYESANVFGFVSGLYKGDLHTR
jgi:hypothetical protein